MKAKKTTCMPTVVIHTPTDHNGSPGKKADARSHAANSDPLPRNNQSESFQWKQMHFFPDRETKEGLKEAQVLFAPRKPRVDRLQIPFTPAQYQETLPRSSALRKGYDPPPSSTLLASVHESLRLYRIGSLPYRLLEPRVCRCVPLYIQGFGVRHLETKNKSVRDGQQWFQEASNVVALEIKEGREPFPKATKVQGKSK